MKAAFVVMVAGIVVVVSGGSAFADPNPAQVRKHAAASHRCADLFEDAIDRYYEDKALLLQHSREMRDKAEKIVNAVKNGSQLGDLRSLVNELHTVVDEFKDNHLGDVKGRGRAQVIAAFNRLHLSVKNLSRCLNDD